MHSTMIGNGLQDVFASQTPGMVDDGDYLPGSVLQNTRSLEK
jgi:hypothetical protein